MEEQLMLPFGYQFAEDRASLLIAINASGLRRLDHAFVLLVHDMTGNGWLHKSYNEIADRLHVSRSTAWRCVKRCVDAGLVVAVEERYRTGGQRDNAYSIDWEGVRAYCFNRTLSEGPALQGEVGAVQTEQGALQGEVGAVQTEHPYKEYIPPSDPLLPPPPPKSEPGGGGTNFDWKGVEERLKAHGMADSLGAVKAAKLAELDPDGVHFLIDQWESKRPAWDVGGLYWRLTRGNWPPESKEADDARLAEARERDRQRQRAELARMRSDADQAAAQSDELERRWGATLDAMPPAELAELAAQCCSDDWLLKLCNRDRGSPLVRPVLLGELARSQEVTA